MTSNAGFCCERTDRYVALRRWMVRPSAASIVRPTAGGVFVGMARRAMPWCRSACESGVCSALPCLGAQMSDTAAAMRAVYKPRSPQASPLFRLVSDHLHRLRTGLRRPLRPRVRPVASRRGAGGRQVPRVRCPRTRLRAHPLQAARINVADTTAGYRSSKRWLGGCRLTS
jgi:hypothetical protein